MQLLNQISPTVTTKYESESLVQNDEKAALPKEEEPRSFYLRGHAQSIMVLRDFIFALWYSGLGVVHRWRFDRETMCWWPSWELLRALQSCYLGQHPGCSKHRGVSAPPHQFDRHDSVLQVAEAGFYANLLYALDAHPICLHTDQCKPRPSPLQPLLQ